MSINLKEQRYAALFSLIRYVIGRLFLLCFYSSGLFLNIIPVKGCRLEELILLAKTRRWVDDRMNFRMMTSVTCSVFV